MQTIFPILRYNDIRSLCATFGFVELFSVPESGPFVRHAQLIGTNVMAIYKCQGAAMACPPKDTDHGSTTSVIWRGISGRSAHTSPLQMVDSETRPLRERWLASSAYSNYDVSSAPLDKPLTRQSRSNW